MIIFINGSINSGKSTIAKILADRIDKLAVIETDSLRNFISWLPIDEAIPINLKNTLSVIKNFLEAKINVVVPYPLSKKNYEFFVEGLKDGKQDIYIFTLSPKLEVALENRGARSLSDWEKERIKHHYNIGIANPGFGVIIDNSDENPEETAARILKIINQK